MSKQEFKTQSKRQRVPFEYHDEDGWSSGRGDDCGGAQVRENQLAKKLAQRAKKAKRQAMHDGDTLRRRADTDKVLEGWDAYEKDQAARGTSPPTSPDRSSGSGNSPSPGSLETKHGEAATAATSHLAHVELMSISNPLNQPSNQHVGFARIAARANKWSTSHMSNQAARRIALRPNGLGFTSMELNIAAQKKQGGRTRSTAGTPSRSRTARRSVIHLNHHCATTVSCTVCCTAH
jgi:hypothetical protein